MMAMNMGPTSSMQLVMDAKLCSECMALPRTRSILNPKFPEGLNPTPTSPLNPRILNRQRPGALPVQGLGFGPEPRLAAVTGAVSYWIGPPEPPPLMGSGWKRGSVLKGTYKEAFKSNSPLSP